VTADRGGKFRQAETFRLAQRSCQHSRYQQICTILTAIFWFTGIEHFSSDLSSEFFLVKRSDAFKVASGEVAQMTQNAHLQDSADSGKPRRKVISIQ
jgi:hypothetical protein